MARQGRQTHALRGRAVAAVVDRVLDGARTRDRAVRGSPT